MGVRAATNRDIGGETLAGNTLTIGNVTVLSLSDGHMDGAVRDMYGDEVTRTWGCGCVSPEAEPEFSTNLGSFLIRSGGQTIMVDTGMGDVEAEGVGGEWGGLFDEMKANKVDAGDVDMVFMTHLHFDHTGWNVSRNGDAPTVLFPKARYVAHEIDWEFFRNEPEAKEKYFYESETVEPLYEMGKLDLVSGEEWVINDEITAIHTPGHTPGHMSLLISSQGEQGLVLGDVAHHPKQVQETGWKVIADCDHDVARETRESVMKMVEEKGLKVAAGHFPAPGFGQIVRLEGKRVWQVL